MKAWIAVLSFLSQKDADALISLDSHALPWNSMIPASIPPPLGTGNDRKVETPSLPAEQQIPGSSAVQYCALPPSPNQLIRSILIRDSELWQE